MTPLPSYTLREEIASSITHGIGIVLAIAGLAVLVAFAARHGDAWHVVSCSIFGAALILCFTTSTLYHSVQAERIKQTLRALDHSAIFLLIAGTYTPFMLVNLRGPWGWSLFGVVWAAAALGVISKLLDRLRHPLWSTGLYVAMGWVVLIAAVPLFERMSGPGLAWLVAGGLSYTLGAVVYLFDSKLRYAHFVWHLFVMGGSACHFCAALWHAAA